MTSKLPLFEWCIIILFCGILFLLGCVALFKKPSHPPLAMSSQELIQHKKQLQVTINGEVSNPGSYELDINTTLKDLLALAHPLPSADLSTVNNRRKLYDGQAVHVHPKVPIQITIYGAVRHPGPFQTMSGTRVNELINQIAFLPEADIQSIRTKRRFLKDGDVLVIPSKKSRSKTQAQMR